jgi:outer membrane protein, heavy metal efflux system
MQMTKNINIEGRSYHRLRFKHRLIAVFAFIFSAIFLLNAQDNLDKMIDEIWQQNPGIQAMQQQINMLQEKETTVQMLMDPMFAMEYSSVPIESWVLDETPMSGIQFKLQQTFPFPGKNKTRQEIAISETESKSWELAEMKLQLAGQFKKVYFMLGMIRKLKIKSEEHIKLLQQLTKSMQSRYETGEANQTDILLMNLMVAKLQDDLKDFDQHDSDLTVALISLLNRNNESFITTEVYEYENSIDDDIKSLIDSAKQNRPIIKKMEQDVQTQRLEMKLVKKDRLPDLTLWAGYRYRQDIGAMPSPDFASIGFSVPLPFDFLNKTNAKHKMFDFKKRVIESNYQDKINKLQAQLKAVFSSLQRANEKIETYENELIPKAETALKMTLTAYENSRADFASLYQAQMQILDFERILIKTKNTAIQNQISLETLIGKTEK